jgi:fibronectin type 3 domain-containing protein
MENLLKRFMIITLVVLIGFLVVSCTVEEDGITGGNPGSGSTTSLTNGVWHNASIPAGQTHYYRFSADAGATYYIKWNDSYEGDGTKTVDIRVNAKWDSKTGTSIFDGADSAYNAPRSVTNNSSSRYIYLEVTPYSGSGSYSIMYSGSASGLAPNTPSSISAAATLTSSITVSWTSVIDATGYHVYRSSESSGSFAKLDSTSSNSYTDTGLSSGTRYYYKVSAYNNSGESALSGSTGATTPVTLIDLTNNVWYDNSIPSGQTHYYRFYADAGATYYIRWNDSYEGDGTKTVDIKVSATWESTTGTGIFSTGDSAYNTPRTVTNNSSSRYIYLEVTPYSGSGSYSIMYSGSGSGLVPNAPSSISSAATLTSSITVSWTSVVDASGYYVYRSSSSSGPFAKLDSTSSNSYTDTGLSSGTRYYYKVSAYNNSGESALSGYTGATTPDTLINLTSGTWYDNSMPAGQTHYYRFYANAGTTYYIKWNDSYEDDKTKTVDIRVYAKWDSTTGTNIFSSADSAYNTPRTVTNNSSDGRYIYLEVTPYSGSGTYSIMYQQ